jgi:tRNA threonylcarbamoyladenosine biosynthesis protein TsaE
MAKYRNLTLLQVKKLAEQTAKKTGSNGITIGLSGNLGSGKTTFAKALAKALGIKTLKSPTFIVSQRYPLKNPARHAKHAETGGRFLYHIDFYRLDHKKDLNVLGLAEILNGDNLVLIEWVGKFPQIKNKCNLLINFIVKPSNKRDVTIQTN